MVRQHLFVSMLVFHALYALACGRVAWRWRPQVITRTALGGTRAALSDAGWLLLTAVVGAVLATLLGAGSEFTIVRLLAQGLFGETVVLGLALTAFVLRAGQTVAGTLVGLVTVGLLAVYAEAYHREPTDLQVEHHEVAARDAGERHLTILHLSDLQMDRLGAYEERALQTARAQPVDLVVFTGDYVQPRVDPTRGPTTRALNERLRRLAFHPPLGAYAVRGDTDRDWPRVVEGTGIVALSGETARVRLPDGRFLSVVGLTREMSHGGDAEEARSLVRAVPAGDLCIVVGHGPDFVMALAEGDAVPDLALAGHTHGGQVVLPFWGALLTKTELPRPYARGLRSYRGIPLHVSAGVGMERGTAPQIRFLCPPEICVIDVRY